MPLTVGDKLGPYEILAPIGVGGMGEVWKARDTRLDRTVAIKTSKQEFSERFEREARAVAALNHPNICALYDVGPNYIVMEYVEGEPLLSKAKPGPLPLNRALDYASQIAAALDAAHSKKITHRDLKPANILVTKQGIKLLDFGLAKIDKPVAGPNDATLTMGLTQQGAIMGTLHYMSPEQINGKEADSRSDIFSFGLVLYEMLTGKRAFTGDTAASVMGAILERPAPSVSDVAPAALDRVLKKCLAKDPEDRWQSARDLKTALELAAQPAGIAQLAPSIDPPRASSKLPWAVTGVFGLAATILGLLFLNKPAPSPLPTMHFEIAAPENTVMQKFGISPDGKAIAYWADADGRSGLWVRPIDSPQARRIAESIANPPSFFWSRDGKSIYYAAGDELDRVAKVDVAGGAPRLLTPGGGGVINGGSETPQGDLIFANSTGVWRLPSGGGSPASVVALDPKRNETSFGFPLMLADGRHFVFLRRSSDQANTGIYIGSLDLAPNAQPMKLLVETPINAALQSSADGSFLLFLREGELYAQRFDEDSASLDGDPVRIGENIGNYGSAGYFGVSSNGLLVYRNGSTATTIGRTFKLTEFDRSGAARPLQPADAYGALSLSPSGNLIAVSRNRPNGAADIWTLDLSRKSAPFNRVTFNTNERSQSPVWSPDGGTLAFYENAPVPGIFRRAADGSGTIEPIQVPGRAWVLNHWSRDGKYLIYTAPVEKTRSDLWITSTEGGKPQPYLATAANEMHAQFSPDGRWVAYTSDESGTQEVYVQPFPINAGGGGKWLVSNKGGSMPRWRHDGKELFYLGADGIMSVDVTSGAALHTSEPKRLFTASIIRNSNGHTWDVSSDGKHFYAETDDRPSVSPIQVIVGWAEAIKK